MNSKQVKQLRKKVKQFQLEWMQSLVSEDEAKKITFVIISENGCFQVRMGEEQWARKKLIRWLEDNRYSCFSWRITGFLAFLGG